MSPELRGAAKVEDKHLTSLHFRTGTSTGTDFAVLISQAMRSVAGNPTDCPGENHDL